MKPLRIVLSVLLLAVVCLALGMPVLSAPKAAAKEIKFFDFKAGMALQKKHKMPTMIHFTTDWCGWCRKLEKDVYTQSEVIALAQKFVCMKVDGDKEKDVTAYYKVTGYPTIIFTDADRNEVLRIPGYVGAEQFANAMKTALQKAGVKTEADAADDKKDDKTE